MADKQDRPRVSVHMQPAKVSDAETLATIQAANMRRGLTAALGAPLSANTLALLNVDSFAHAWHKSISLAKQNQSVIVAASTSGVHGFIAGEVTDNADGELVYAVTALELDDFAREQRMGDLLISYVSDYARDHWAEALTMWVLAGDDTATAEAAAAGLAPTGATQAFTIEGQQLTQHQWRLALL